LTALIFLALLIVGVVIVVSVNNSPVNDATLLYTYEIIKTYPHDEKAFTEGLAFDNGVLYESTGLYGNSTLRRVQLETGKTQQVYALQNQFFAEGITIVDNRIIQLTWQSHVGFVYDKNTFDVLQEYNYSTEGWGITNDGNQLIMSDGTANLILLDPRTFEKIGQVQVHSSDPVTNLNELEYVNGKVYANIWKTRKIAIINLQNGRVEGWIDLTGLPGSQDGDPNSVLNGIAYDAVLDRLFVTGKMWPWLYEIKPISRAQ
jgi:glutaminyl-peptide cyclotransferase